MMRATPSIGRSSSRSPSAHSASLPFGQLDLGDQVPACAVEVLLLYAIALPVEHVHRQSMLRLVDIDAAEIVFLGKARSRVVHRDLWARADQDGVAYRAIHRHAAALPTMND